MTTAPASIVRSAVAVPMGPTAVHVLARRGDRGPWSIIADLPDGDREPAGPPPGALVLAGIASCTIVTVAGVASRGASALEGMTVSFDVDAEGDRLEIRDRTVISSHASDTDRLRFTRAAAGCPVGKIFTQRAIAIEDAVELREGGREALAVPPAPVFASGTVSATWLPATCEWSDRDGRRLLEQEGEVAIHIDVAAPGSRRSRFGLLGGHSRAGWAPRPSPYAMAGLASSTLMTLRVQAARLGLDPSTLHVEVRALSPVPDGGKEGAQEAAASGKLPQVRWSRTVSARVTAGAQTDAVLEAMRRDPIYGHCMRGDLFRSRELVIEPARVATAS